MKRWPVLVSFVLFLALCASVAGWALQWFRPAARPVAAAPVPEAPVTVQLQAASTLFGARAQASAPAAGYVLKGVIVARKPGDNVAIMAVEGQPPQALREGAEVAPGVKVTKVHPQFVLLSENGREKRVELPDSAPTSPGGPETRVEAPQKGGPVPEKGIAAPQPAAAVPEQSVVIQRKAVPSPRGRERRAHSTDSD